MKYMNSKEACLKWGVSERRVRELCQEGRISNVIRSGKTWLIPAEAARPLTKKALAKNPSEERLELYLNPVYCDQNLHSKLTYEEELICQANNFYFEGYFESAEEKLNEVLAITTLDSYKVIAYMTLNLIYVLDGKKQYLIDQVLYNLASLLDKNPQFHYTKEFVKLFPTEDTETVNLSDIPEKYIPAFTEAVCAKNIFNILSGKYVAEIYIFELLSNLLNSDEQPGLMLIIHIIFAVFYNIKNEKELYDIHMAKILEIALPRKWYAPLAEYSYTLDWHEIKAIDINAYNEINEFSNRIIRNYIRSGFFNKSFSPREKIDANEIKVEYLVSCGKSNAEISSILNMSLYQVKKYIKKIYSHTNTTNRNEIIATAKEQLKIF